MQFLDVVGAGKNYRHTWPDGSREPYASWVDYRARSTHSEHIFRVAFGWRDTYGQRRRRVLVMIDGHPHAEFVGADDYEQSGEVLSEVKVPGNRGERMCRYPDEAVPERYSGLPVVGLPTRIIEAGVHKAWAIVVNVSDHRMMCTLAALRRVERER